MGQPPAGLPSAQCLTPSFREVGWKSQSHCVVSNYMNKYRGILGERTGKTVSEFTQVPQLEITVTFIQTCFQTPMSADSSTKKPFEFFILFPFPPSSSSHSVLSSFTVMLLQHSLLSCPCPYSSSKAPFHNFPTIPSIYSFHRSDHSMKTGDSSLPPEDALVKTCCSSFNSAHFAL